MATIVQDFWANVNVGAADECWEWKRSRTPLGYGRFWNNGDYAYAHRHAYELTRGVTPSGMFVCHSCDNRACCNPSHLWIGSAQENIRDRDDKGRGKACVRKITPFIIVDIYNLQEQGKSIEEIALQFSLHKATVKAVLNDEYVVRRVGKSEQRRLAEALEARMEAI